MSSRHCINRHVTTVVAMVVLFSGISIYSTNMDEELRITYEQKIKLDKLKSRVFPFLTERYMKEDLNLIRWLRATKFNLEEAERRIIENIKWRKENKMGTIDLEDFSDIADEYPYLFTTDKQGQPTFIGFAGEWDLRAAAVTGRTRRVNRYINQALEEGTRMVRQMQYSGKNVTRLNLLIDLDGFNIHQHGCVQCLIGTLEFIVLYDNNYPGMADKIIFTNTPPTVAAATEVVRAGANAITLKAMKVYGTDKNVWQKALLQFIDKDHLPVELGGVKKRKDFSNRLVHP